MKDIAQSRVVREWRENGKRECQRRAFESLWPCRVQALCEVTDGKLETVNLDCGPGNALFDQEARDLQSLVSLELDNLASLFVVD